MLPPATAPITAPPEPCALGGAVAVEDPGAPPNRLAMAEKSFPLGFPPPILLVTVVADDGGGRAVVGTVDPVA